MCVWWGALHHVERWKGSAGGPEQAAVEAGLWLRSVASSLPVTDCAELLRVWLMLLPACRFFLGTWNMAGFLSENRPIRTLREILTRLRETYSGNIGFEVGRRSLWAPVVGSVCVRICLANFASLNVWSATAPATAAATATHTHPFWCLSHVCSPLLMCFVAVHAHPRQGPLQLAA